MGIFKRNQPLKGIPVEEQPNNPWRHVRASSFADPRDVERFKACKRLGKSDNECFAVGDNGIGCWGDDTTTDVPMVALPREMWEHLGKLARLKPVRVRNKFNDKEIVAKLGDTMPRLANIKNGRGIDLNPAACKALGISIPADAEVMWRWEV